MSYVDSHAHLDDAAYGDQVEGVVERAIAAGVAAIVTAGVDVASSVRSIALAERFGPVWAAVGIHPHDTAAADSDAIDQLRGLARQNKVVAIGEIGLDYYRNHSPVDVQKRLFEHQLDLASEFDLPVCIHAREAYDDVLNAVERWVRRGAPERPGMLHCFAGTVDQARRGLELGLMISIAGPVTFPSARQLAEVVQDVPFDRLLIETDCPYLAPQSIRGKRNEPARVTDVAARIGELKSTEVILVAGQTSANARALFRLSV